MESVKIAKGKNKKLVTGLLNRCHDCKKEIKIENKRIKNGLLLKYENDGKDVFILKCNECFKKNPSLINFQECEVYSRVVGYLRPVNQWNVGKQQEFKDRKEFKVKKAKD
jgi:ribonucleoside-triphosphate reductase